MDVDVDVANGDMDASPSTPQPQRGVWANGTAAQHTPLPGTPRGDESFARASYEQEVATHMDMYHQQQQQQQQQQLQQQQQQQQQQHEQQQLEADGSLDSPQLPLTYDEYLTSLRRVKLYELDSSTLRWEDRGTGQVDIHYVEHLRGMCIVVMTEPADAAAAAPHHDMQQRQPQLLFQGRVSFEDIYKRQQNTLIVWNEPYSDVDLALSFQDPAGCEQVWNILEGIRRGVELPAVQEANLRAILASVTAANTLLEREKLIMSLMNNEYIGKMLALFRVCERRERHESLAALFQIFKTLIQINDSSLLDAMFADDTIMDVIGVLEYDPELLPHQRVRHRDYLRQAAVFKQVLPFSRPDVVQRIHQTFRIQYIKDAVLARTIDDATLGTLNSMIFFNNIEIVSGLEHDNEFLAELFRRLATAERGSQRLADLVQFLQDFVNLAKNLQVKNRTRFFESLREHGLFGALERAIADPLLRVRLGVMEVLYVTLINDAAMVRQYLLQQAPRYALLNALLERLVADQDAGMQAQVTEALKMLLDGDYLSDEVEHDPFLRAFYEASSSDGQPQMCKLLVPLDTPLSAPVSSANAFELGSVRYNVCEILTACVQHHGFLIKAFLVENEGIVRVLRLCESREAYLVLAAIRFARQLILTHDAFYVDLIVKGDLLRPVFEAFERNGPTPNLVNSAVIDLCVRVRNLDQPRPLVKYVVETYRHLFEDVTYVSEFRSLIDVYKQLVAQPLAGDQHGSQQHHQQQQQQGSQPRMVRTSSSAAVAAAAAAFSKPIPPLSASLPGSQNAFLPPTPEDDYFSDSIGDASSVAADFPDASYFKRFQAEAAAAAAEAVPSSSTSSEPASGAASVVSPAALFADASSSGGSSARKRRSEGDVTGDLDLDGLSAAFVPRRRRMSAGIGAGYRSGSRRGVTGEDDDDDEEEEDAFARLTSAASSARSKGEKKQLAFKFSSSVGGGARSSGSNGDHHPKEKEEKAGGEGDEVNLLPEAALSSITFERGGNKR